MNIYDFIYDNRSEITSMLVGSLITAIIILLVIERQHLKWFVREVMKMYSGEKSFFSKKRMESSIAFFVAEGGAVLWLKLKYASMDTSDFLMWLSPQLFVAGWVINAIQKEKALSAGGNGSAKPEEDGGGNNR